MNNKLMLESIYLFFVDHLEFGQFLAFLEKGEI